MAITQITEYQVQYSSNTFPPRIWLKNGENYVGQLIFLPDGSALPPDNSVGNQVFLYYHLEDFANTFRLLAEEKTVYLVYNGTGGGFENGLQTTAEVLGDLP